jgi:SAM-dependent methyltransferase
MTIGEAVYEAGMAPLEALVLAQRRRGLLSRARGRILEVGAGTGANLAWYDPEARKALVVSDIDPGPALARRCRRSGLAAPLRADIGELPFEDGSFDTVVGTLLFCSVDDPGSGLAEIRRVLRRGGSYLFIEHVASSRAGIGRLQRRLSPAWRRIAQGCHLDRDTESAIRGAGFEVLEIERFLAVSAIAGSARAA